MKSHTLTRLSFLATTCLLLSVAWADNDDDLHALSSINARANPKRIKHMSDKVHGVIMGLTVVLIFPLGAMSGKLLHRILSPRALFWTHVCCQTFGLTLLITGFGLGIWVAVLHSEVYNDPTGHVVLGTIIVGLFLMQPFIGIWHHQLHKASKTNKFLRQGHIWLGRILIVLAIVNGGTGLQIGNNTIGGEKVYGILAGIVGVTYLVLIVMWYVSRSKADKENVDRNVSEPEPRHDTEVEEGREIKMTKH